MRSIKEKRELAAFVLDARMSQCARRPEMRGILLIPFKSLATAKQRLAAALDQRNARSWRRRCCAT